MGSSVAAGQPLTLSTQNSRLVFTMWLSPDQMNSLMYWDNPRDSGIVCGSVLVNLSLALVTATMSFRIYKSVLAAVNKNNEGHPFRQFLEVDVTLPVDKVSSLADTFFSKLNNVLLKLKSILLVENVVESVKFAVAMYLLTYVGAIMNGLTILTLAWVAVFSAPRVYRDNQKQIDEAVLPLKTKLDDLQAKLQASLPAAITGKKDE